MASLAEAAQPAPQRAAALAIPGMTSHFTLKTVEGRDVTEASFPGKWLVIYFGYTRCPDACPTALNTIGAALTELGHLLPGSSRSSLPSIRSATLRKSLAIM